MSHSPHPADSPYLIVGLGNPGPRYAHTRHNTGFVVVDELTRRHGLRFSKGQANAEVARGSINGIGSILAKPMTYMNNSGQAVGALARYYKIPLDHLLVVYDDFALPLGTIRIREKGSAGGHNGLESIIRHLGTQNFPRVRVGVDQPVQAQESHVDWVLGRFSKQELGVMNEVVPRAADAIVSILQGGIERAMNRYNTRDSGSEPEAPDRTPDTVFEAPPQARPKTNRWVEKLRSIYGKGVGER